MANVFAILSTVVMFKLGWRAKIAVLLAVFACCSASLAAQQNAAVEACTNQNLTLSKDFASGRFKHCKWVNSSEFELSLVAENVPINPSPWYAFKIEAEQASTATIVLNYGDAKHRYWPKISHDFIHWQRLTAQQLSLNNDGTRLRMQLEVNQGSTWIAAQPVVNNQHHLAWLHAMQQRSPQVSVVEFAQSIQGRSLWALESKTLSKRPTLVLLGRQHPPEITGAFALQYFVETLLQDTPLAHVFRQQFNLVVIPNINPDGVAAGNWRHNANGVDLNRDWGPFKQLETRATDAYIADFIANRELWMVIDFHSTRRDIFYIQQTQQATRFPDLVENWIGAINLQQSAIEFAVKPGYSPNNATAKTYFYKQYQIPTLTYELSDDSPLDKIKVSSHVAARTLMERLVTEITH